VRGQRVVPGAEAVFVGYAHGLRSARYVLSVAILPSR
jgi:hypothetical protein